MTLCEHDTLVPSLQCFRSYPFRGRRWGTLAPSPAFSGGFPLLLTLGGCPTSFANFAHEQQCPPETEETPQEIGIIASGGLNETPTVFWKLWILPHQNHRPQLIMLINIK